MTVGASASVAEKGAVGMVVEAVVGDGATGTDAARIRRYERTYVEEYGYEAWLVRGRRMSSLATLETVRPARVVEVGCGIESLAPEGLDVGGVERWVIVEPSRPFVESARAATRDLPAATVVEGFFEAQVDAVRRALGGPADLVIIDGLLHELADPAPLVRAAASLLRKGGCVHASVPNANSLHRRVARAMGLIDDVHALSERNRTLEQARVYDMVRLREFLEGVGLGPVRSGGHTIKPFTNGQMAEVEAALGPAVLDGLLSLGHELPEIAAEIWIDAER